MKNGFLKYEMSCTVAFMTPSNMTSVTVTPGSTHIKFSADLLPTSAFAVFGVTIPPYSTSSFTANATLMANGRSFTADGIVVGFRANSSDNFGIKADSVVSSTVSGSHSIGSGQLVLVTVE